MKICLFGGACSGKTTLAIKIANELKILYYSGSGSNVYKMYGYTNYLEIPDDIRIKMQWDLLFLRDETELNGYNSISDRSPIDNYIYMLGIPSINKKELEKYRKYCLHQLRYYDIIFYIETLDFYDESSYRCSEIQAYRDSLMMLGFAKKYNISNINVKYDTVENRINFMLEKIRECNEKII